MVGMVFVVDWIFYKTILRNVSAERHRNLQKNLKFIAKQFIIFSAWFALFLFWKEQFEGSQVQGLHRLTPYLGLVALVWGGFVFVRASKLLVLQYLFMGSMQAGVPLLIENIFSLILSISMILWCASHIFFLQLAPLLATSAAFSIILGLAMQDTLGNIFAGLSLQIDKNFEIGDWVEVVNGVQKAVGQVQEISWRSTTLIGLSDEVIVYPNRIMAQAQLSNFSPLQPILRSQLFRFPLDENLDRAIQVLEAATQGLEGICQVPPPLAYVHENSDSWASLKVIYYINQFGSQYSIGDRVIRSCLKALEAQKIKLAKQQFEVWSHVSR